MEPIRDMVPFNLKVVPQHLGIGRLGMETREEAFYTCSVCGEVEPYHVKLTGRWLRRSCACQVAERARHEQAEWRLARLHERARITFDWLGEGRSDMALVEKTFENFAQYRQPGAYEAACTFCVDMEGRTLGRSSSTSGTGD